VDLFDSRLPQSFWDRIIPEPNSGCWLWTGRIDRKGYGRTEIRGFSLAHRLSLSVVQRLDPLLTVDHKCEMKCCVNPLHLQQVTSPQNTRLRSERSTTCTNGHARPPGDCRECRIERQRKYRELKREFLAEIPSGAK
jgi:hypothetical protein